MKILSFVFLILIVSASLFFYDLGKNQFQKEYKTLYHITSTAITEADSCVDIMNTYRSTVDDFFQLRIGP